MTLEGACPLLQGAPDRQKERGAAGAAPVAPPHIPHTHTGQYLRIQCAPPRARTCTHAHTPASLQIARMQTMAAHAGRAGTASGPGRARSRRRAPRPAAHRPGRRGAPPAAGKLALCSSTRSEHSGAPERPLNGTNTHRKHSRTSSTRTPAALPHQQHRLPRGGPAGALTLRYPRSAKQSPGREALSQRPPPAQTLPRSPRARLCRLTSWRAWRRCATCGAPHTRSSQRSPRACCPGRGPR
jgi:hypothetical protein